MKDIVYLKDIPYLRDRLYRLRSNDPTGFEAMLELLSFRKEQAVKMCCVQDPAKPDLLRYQGIVRELNELIEYFTQVGANPNSQPKQSGIDGGGY